MPSARQISIMAEAIRKTQEELMDFLKEKHPSEIMTIEAVRGFFRGKEDKHLYCYIRDKVFPHTQQIKDRKLEFFKDNKNTIFDGLPPKYIDRWTDLILGSPEDDIVNIFTYFQTLASIYEASLKSKKNR